MKMTASDMVSEIISDRISCVEDWAIDGDRVSLELRLTPLLVRELYEELGIEGAPSTPEHYEKLCGLYEHVFGTTGEQEEAL